MADKILFVSTQMEAAGVQIRSTSMQKALLEQGIETHLAFLYKKRAVFAEGSFLRSLSNGQPRGAVPHLLIFRELWKFMRALRPTAVVGFAHYSSPIACLFGALVGAQRRVATQTNPPSTVPRAARALDWLCGTLGIYTHNIAASHSVAKGFAHYPKAYQKRLTVVYNGVGSSVSDLSRDEARGKFGLPLDRPLVINCGRLSHQKNQKFLLHIISEIPGCDLAILGDGELRQELADTAVSLGIADRVHFLGEVPPEEVKDFLRTGDVFAFPSLYEAFGLAVAEAMVSGLPVIASNHPALQEVVSEAGILLPLGESQSWVEAINRVMADTALRGTMAAASQLRASKFTFESMLAGFKDAILLNRAVSQEGSRRGDDALAQD